MNWVILVTLTVGNPFIVFNKYFEIPLMDIQQETVKITIEDTDVDLVMTSKIFHELINEFHNFDENHDFLIKIMSLLFKFSF